jgi:hypothetical protein
MGRMSSRFQSLASSEVHTAATGAPWSGSSSEPTMVHGWSSAVGGSRSDVVEIGSSKAMWEPSARRKVGCSAPTA